MRLTARLFIALFVLSFSPVLSALASEPKHGVSIFGDLKYPANFTNFEYVNPNAPKGGRVIIAGLGTFDSLNPFILKGMSADQIGLIFDTLTKSSADEAGTEYGLIAKTIEVADDRKWVVFTLRDEAKWRDGTKITADDVVFSFNTIKEKGHPQYKSYYHDVASAEKLAENKVKFNFSSSENRELPVIIGQLPIISKAYYEKNKFEETTMQPPMSSGPYEISSVVPGRSITYKRVKNYWGKDLAVNRGYYNFDEIRVDYYRDETVAIEGLKAGEYDFRRENIAKLWANAYNIPQVKDGRMVKEMLPDGTPTGMQSFVFNTRRSDFSNPKVREALDYAYDFEWSNKQLFFSAYSRNSSFFGNSEFASSGLPSKAELKLLEPFRDSLPEAVFTKQYTPPVSDGKEGNRTNLLKAAAMLKEAGFFLRDMKLINPETDKPVEIEFLLSSPSFERVVAPFARNLKKLGIDSTIRTVDASQFIKRKETFDFDIMVHWYVQGPAPGNEQVNYWHSSRADVAGSQNVAGIKNPAVDFLVGKITAAQSKEELITATRALDRVLLWNHYVIPQWYSRTHRVIYWNKFGRPEVTPPYNLGFPDTWWFDKNKESKLQKQRR